MPKAAKVTKLSKFSRREAEEKLVEECHNQHGSVIQRQEARPFKPESAGSNPARPTTNQSRREANPCSINRLIAKQCRCKASMYIHRKDEEILFSGCEPCIVNISIERENEGTILVKGTRSAKAIRCSACRKRHLLRTFDEVKDVDRQEQT